jgi:BioD-like phosphotransacetylase family protein
VEPTGWKPLADVRGSDRSHDREGVVSSTTDRKEFGKLALGGALGRALGAALLAATAAAATHTIQLDNGYYDMNKIMKALRDVNFDGIVILDHSPGMQGGGNAQTAYGFGYMKALLKSG